MAVASPLMETSINGARGVLINITGSADMDLEDVETAASLVQEAAHPEANIIFGATFDDTLEDEIRVTVIATGFEDTAMNGEDAANAAQTGAAQANAPAFTPVRPAAGRERPQGLFTGATEKAAAAQPVQPVAPAPAAAAQPAAAPAKPAGGEEDPFDSIFKIFNANK